MSRRRMRSDTSKEKEKRTVDVARSEAEEEKKQNQDPDHSHSQWDECVVHQLIIPVLRVRNIMQRRNKSIVASKISGTRWKRK
mmetsp:Transcript_43974/g.44638  ORF Transcript_43974/g.44638 Transcript_43974/m.44638 type:complete len:83 (-) Transcript_43974:282-530(-)